MEENSKIENLSIKTAERKMSSESTSISVSQNENVFENNYFTKNNKNDFSKLANNNSKSQEINYFSGVENHFRNEYPEKFVEYKMTKNYILKNNKNNEIPKIQNITQNNYRLPFVYVYYPFYGFFYPQQYNNNQMNYYILQKKDNEQKENFINKKKDDEKINNTDNDINSEKKNTNDNSDIIVEKEKRSYKKNYKYSNNYYYKNSYFNNGRFSKRTNRYNNRYYQDFNGY